MPSDDQAPRAALPLPDDRLGWWLSRSARGDEQAMERVYDLTCREVHRLATLIARGDVTVAEQVLRRTYAEIWARLASGEEIQGPARTWVLALAWRCGRPGADGVPGSATVVA